MQLRARSVMTLVFGAAACHPPAHALFDVGPPPPTPPTPPASDSYRLEFLAVSETAATTPAGTIQNFMSSTAGRDEPFFDYLMDEAVITSLTEDQVCIALTVRSDHTIDAPPSQWNVHLAGHAVDAVATAPHEDTFWPAEQVLRARRGVTVVTTEPRGGYTVRRARVCGDRHRPAREYAEQGLSPSPRDGHFITLDVEIPQANSVVTWGARFRWGLSIERSWRL